ncbi:metalloregulator ArsR/SmtB family transcription factor [Bacillus sp. Marseille-Q3570]|uniref:ArsR/SmtB family transcription factor n=1 Tax=Bacillus sp. Marseille-Q3570 TaxID=2963522 RepID=UPI0021B82BFE|nr:metalloregulator ArsR/SmtB family transcription factor [Bacillus sp. Marseille-Q3570]
METTLIETEKAAQVLKLLGDKTRLTIISLVNEQECCVCEFVEILKMSQPAISQHLRKLRDAGLVKEQRKGQWIFYSINKEFEGYSMIKEILKHVPDGAHHFEALEKAGLRIRCT